MTDLEITRLCALALSETTYFDVGDSKYRMRDSDATLFDPLHDDAQALALVKELHIQLDKTLRTPVDKFGKWIASRTDKFVSEPTDDLNRAICECAAKIQASK